MSQELGTYKRKKEFNTIFNTIIVPFFKTEGFERHTQTSKRLCIKGNDGLSVFIFFEYKLFGYGFYDISIVYFDDEIGNVYDDIYIAIAQIKTPTIEGNNFNELDASAHHFLKKMESEVIPFIKKHLTHISLLESSVFSIPKGRENKIIELLKKKSGKKGNT